MAKKEVTPESAVSQFKDAIERSKINTLYREDTIIVGENDDGASITIIPDQNLLAMLLNDSEVKLTDFDRSNPNNDLKLSRSFNYGTVCRDDNECWFDLTKDTKFFDGDSVEVSVDEHDFPVIISKDLLPMKLKKAEFTNVDYRVFPSESLIAIRKRFEPLPEYGFTIMRLFQII